jgi:serine/threonine protein kinase
MLFGKTPFKAETQNQTFLNITQSKLKFPTTPNVSKNAKNLITALLNPNQKKRLGSKTGARLFFLS